MDQIILVGDDLLVVMSPTQAREFVQSVREYNDDMRLLLTLAFLVAFCILALASSLDIFGNKNLNSIKTYRSYAIWRVHHSHY